MSHLIRVGVLRGGQGREHDLSLASGAAVIHALNYDLGDRYLGRDILVTRNGEWRIDGEPFMPGELPEKVDIIFNTMRGHFGEDGKVQDLMASINLPQVGSRALPSALGMNKILSKNIFKENGLPSPYYRSFASEEIHRESAEISRKLFYSLILPVIVKPATGSSVHGLTIVSDYASLENALKLAARHAPTVIIEEFIRGEEGSCLVIENFRGRDLYTLPTVEIRHTKPLLPNLSPSHRSSQIIVPAAFGAQIKAKIEELSLKVHRLLGLRHYSKCDFIVHPSRGVFLLEANGNLGFSKSNPLPQALQAVGSSLPEFIDHVIGLELGR